MQEKGDITHGLEDVSDLQKSKWAPIAFAILKMRAKSFKRILKNFDEFRKEPTEEDVEVKFSIGGKTRSSKLMNSNQKNAEKSGQQHNLSQKELIQINMKYQDFLKRHEKCDREL